MTEPHSSPLITTYPHAPTPTRLTLLNRHNPVIQAGKFVGMCANIMMMVIKGHEK